MRRVRSEMLSLLTALALPVTVLVSRSIWVCTDDVGTVTSTFGLARWVVPVTLLKSIAMGAACAGAAAAMAAPAPRRAVVASMMVRRR